MGLEISISFLDLVPISFVTWYVNNRTGVLSFNSLPDSVDEMIHQAHALMYEAKARGKNNILFLES